MRTSRSLKILCVLSAVALLGAAPAFACDGAKAASASSGSACASKAATAQSASADGCASKAATAQSAGAACASKGASAQSAGASCASKGASAQSAGADGCCAKGAAAQSAGADGAACASKGAAAQSAGAACASKTADAQSADAGKAACSTTAQTAYVFNVSGMTCGGCATKVEAAVANLKMNGVKECSIDLEAATATVTYEASEDQTPDATIIAKAITDAGFKAEVRTAEQEAPEKPAAS